MLPALSAGQGRRGACVHCVYLRVSGGVCPLGVDKVVVVKTILSMTKEEKSSRTREYTGKTTERKTSTSPVSWSHR